MIFRNLVKNLGVFFLIDLYFRKGIEISFMSTDISNALLINM